MSSIFEGRPPKTRPFAIKTRVIWVPGIYMRAHMLKEKKSTNPKISGEIFHLKQAWLYCLSSPGCKKATQDILTVRITWVSTQKYGKTPKSSYFNRVFHYKPSILGYPYIWKHPHVVIQKSPVGLFPFKKKSPSKTRFWKPLEFSGIFVAFIFGCVHFLP